jgi:hypothetical protein
MATGYFRPFTSWDRDHNLDDTPAVSFLEPKIPIFAVAWRGDGHGWLRAPTTQSGDPTPNVYVWNVEVPKQPIHIYKAMSPRLLMSI